MFLLNSGRYVIADPAAALSDKVLKRLWGSSVKFDSYVLNTDNGTVVALPMGKSGHFRTDQGKVISTDTAHIAFIPYLAAGRLLPFEVIRVSLSEPSLLFFDARNNIVLDGKLIIYR